MAAIRNKNHLSLIKFEVFCIYLKSLWLFLESSRQKMSSRRLLLILLLLSAIPSTHTQYYDTCFSSMWYCHRLMMTNPAAYQLSISWCRYKCALMKKKPLAFCHYLSDGCYGCKCQ